MSLPTKFFGTGTSRLQVHRVTRICDMSKHVNGNDMRTGEWIRGMEQAVPGKARLTVVGWLGSD